MYESAIKLNYENSFHYCKNDMLLNNNQNYHSFALKILASYIDILLSKFQIIPKVQSIKMIKEC